MNEREPVWRVRASEHASVVGPVTMDQLKRGLESGKLSGGEQAAIIGTDDWRPIHAIVAAPASASAPGAGRRLGRIAAIVSMVVLVMGATAIGGYFLLRKRPPPPSTPRTLPIVAKKLPPRTLRISEHRIRGDLDEVVTVPDALTTSALASGVCGGSDVADILGLSRGQGLDVLSKLGVLDLGNPRIRDGIRCAEAIRKTLQAPSIIEVAFADGDDVRSVEAIRSNIKELPADLGFVRHNFAGMYGACLRLKDAKEDCSESSLAAFRDGDTWIFGKVAAVESFARSYTSAHDELTTTVEILQELVAQTRGADNTSIIAKPETIPWTDVCRRAAPIGKMTEFVKACFPGGQESVIKSVESKVRGLAIERDMMARASTFGLTYVLLARDEEAARDIEKDLRDLTRDWRAHIANNEGDLVKLIRAKSEYVHDKFWEAALDPFLRAIRSATVVRMGSVVRLSMAEPLRPTEAKELKEFAEARSGDQQAAVRVVESILAGDPLPQSSLAVFTGRDVAAWIAAPRASAEECDELTKKLATLTGADLPPEQFGLKLQLEENFSAKKCVGMVLPTEAKKCLTGAPTATVFASCKLPSSPFALAASAKLEGQWKVANVHATKPLAWGVREQFEAAVIEFKQGRVAFAFADGLAESDAGIEATQTGRATFVLPVGNKLLPRTAVFGDDGGWSVPDFAEGVEVTFKMATLPASLTAAKTKP